MKRKNTLILVIFLTLVAIVVIGLFVFFLDIINNNNKNIVTTLAVFQNKVNEKENAIIFEKKVNEIKSLQESINNNLVDPNKIDTFVGFLENINLITGASVSVKSIEVSQTVKNTISFNLLIGGTFDQVVKTITYLENIPFQVNLTRLYLNKDITTSEIITTKIKTPEISTWQADVSFSILSLN